MKPHKTQWYLQRIREEFPRLKWTNYRRVQTHSRPDHVMFLLDNGIAFRFENDVVDEDTDLARERTVLDLIRPRLSDIPIPEYAYVPKSSNDFAGYRTIPGTRLSPWRFQRLSKARRHSEARRLGRFLSALHKTPLEPVRKLGVEARDKSPGNRSMASRLMRERWKDLDRRTRDVFQGWIQRSGEINHDFSPVLTHFDLWSKHIYHDPRTGKLTGIIDWGDVRISDPAKDFYGFWVYGEAFLDDVLSHYDLATQGLRDRSFEHFWGIAIQIWFDSLDGISGVAGHFFHPSTWTKRPLSDWPLSQYR